MSGESCFGTAPLRAGLSTRAFDPGIIWGMTAGPHSLVALRREPLLLAPATVAGLVIAYLDSRPGSDSTGITVGALVVCSFAAAWLSGRRPWLWALLVGIWTPLVEVPSGTPAALVALVFASLGAVAGFAAARFLGQDGG